MQVDPPGMNSPRQGRSINVNLSDEARDGWGLLAREHGTDVTALLEIMGRRLAEGVRPRWLAEIGREARDLSYDRRRRG